MSRLCLRDRVVSALYGYVPIADNAVCRSGLEVSPNGRRIKLSLHATDGGLGRPVAVWEAYLDLAIALLREHGLMVRVVDPGLKIEVSEPLVMDAACDAPTVRCEVVHG